MHSLCSIRKLVKSYRSGFKLGPVDLVIPPGEIVGLIGQNGAGKTTLLRSLLGLLHPDSGGVTLLGSQTQSTDPRILRQDIGYVDEEPIFYDWMPVPWLARFVAYFYRDWDSDAFARYLRRLDIPESRRYGSLSRGNKVKLAIALALSHQPTLILMDEPTSGLDPIVRQEILRLLGDYRLMVPEASVIFSSHITSDLEQVCDRAVALDEGQVIFDEYLANLSPSRPAGTPSHESRSAPSPLEQFFVSMVNKSADGGKGERPC